MSFARSGKMQLQVGMFSKGGRKRIEQQIQSPFGSHVAMMSQDPRWRRAAQLDRFKPGLLGGVVDDLQSFSWIRVVADESIILFLAYGKDAIHPLDGPG